MWELAFVQKYKTFFHKLFLALPWCLIFEFNVTLLQARDIPEACADPHKLPHPTVQISLCDDPPAGTLSFPPAMPSQREVEPGISPSHGFAGFPPMGDGPPMSDFNLFPDKHSWLGDGQLKAEGCCHAPAWPWGCKIFNTTWQRSRHQKTTLRRLQVGRLPGGAFPWTKSPGPWSMLHFPIGMHFQNSNSKVTFMISRQWLQDSSGHTALCDCSGCTPMRSTLVNVLLRQNMREKRYYILLTVRFIPRIEWSSGKCDFARSGGTRLS